MLSPRTVACPPPSRPRAADQLLELFLHAWHGGRFTHRLHWLPQNRRHVAVIGRDVVARAWLSPTHGFWLRNRSHSSVGSRPRSSPSPAWTCPDAASI